MKTCRCRCSGSSCEEFGEKSQDSDGSWTAACAQDEVDRLPDGDDLRSLLVGHLHAEGVLELLHERVEVQRVGLEVDAEVRAVVDPRGIDLELVDEVRLDHREDFVSGHCAETVEPRLGHARRPACAARRRARARRACAR